MPLGEHRYTDLHAQITRLKEALKPFANVIEILHTSQELDRDMRIGFVPVHANGPGASSLLKTFGQDDFQRAYDALR